MGTPPPRRAAVSWALFDVANSAFPLVMITAVFVIYFKNVIVGGDDPSRSDFLWGLSISISAGLVALISPLLGAFADLYGARKRILLLYTLIATSAVFALSFAQPGMIAFAMVAFILANGGFEGGTVFYSSLLQFVTTPEKVGRLSGIGWSLGYVGGLACLLLSMDLAMAGEVLSVLRIVAIWFLVFSVPLFLWVPEPPPNPSADKRPFRSLAETLRAIWKAPTLRLFFIAYFIYNDAIITIFAFFAPFAVDTLGFTYAHIIKVVIGIQITGAIGAFGFGLLADKIGHGRTIVATLAIWVTLTALAFVTSLDLPIWAEDAARAQEQMLVLQGADAALVDDGNATIAPSSPLRKNIFSVLALIIGFAMGATQASSRAFLSSVAPEDSSGRLFGFYAIAGRFSAVVGPTAFGAISYATGSKSWSVLSLVFLFAVGLALMTRVNEQKIHKELQSWSA